MFPLWLATFFYNWCVYKKLAKNFIYVLYSIYKQDVDSTICLRITFIYWLCLPIMTDFVVLFCLILTWRSATGTLAKSGCIRRAWAVQQWTQNNRISWLTWILYWLPARSSASRLLCHRWWAKPALESWKFSRRHWSETRNGFLNKFSPKVTDKIKY